MKQIGYMPVKIISFKKKAPLSILTVARDPNAPPITYHVADDWVQKNAPSKGKSVTMYGVCGTRAVRAPGE